jgi:hypothetical protein
MGFRNEDVFPQIIKKTIIFGRITQSIISSLPFINTQREKDIFDKKRREN